MKKKIIICGVGGVANYVYRHIDTQRVEVLAHVNPYTFCADVKGFRGHCIIDIKEIKELEYDYILIASGNPGAVKAKLESLGISSDKIIAFIFDNGNDTAIYETVQHNLNTSIREIFNDKILQEIMPNYQPRTFFPVTTWFSDTDIITKSHDFVREKQLHLLAQEIIRNDIKGAVAECGVYKGEFSKLINAFFPNRDLYLFDTFEGFNISDIQQEVSKDNGGGGVDTYIKRFSNTNVDIVLEKMPHKEKCIIKKGLFPQTFDLHNDVLFAFVSLDMDLYQPIYAGLEIFYPRLSRGGIIMVHDYNNEIYPKCKEAVQEYCQKHQIPIIPLPDFYGSAMIIKQ